MSDGAHRDPPAADAIVQPARVVDAIISRNSAEGSVRTGFPSLDALLGGGLRPGDLVVLAGDVAVGKSSLALAIALRANAAGHPAAFLSGEMLPDRLVERVLAFESRVSIDAIRHGVFDAESRRAVATAGTDLAARLPVLPRLSSAGVAQIEEVLANRRGLELVIVDPLQFLASGTGRLAYEEELASIVRALKALALEFRVVVLVVTHLGRAVRDRSDPRPVLEDLGAMGAIRQHADIVLGLFREELYAPAPGIEGAAELHVLKNRNGPTRLVDLYFYKECVRFEDMAE